MSIAAVQTRMIEIQSRLNSGLGTNSASGSANDFSALLDQASSSATASSGRLGGTALALGATETSSSAASTLLDTEGLLSSSTTASQGLSTQDLITQSLNSLLSNASSGVSFAQGSAAGQAIVTQGMKHLGTPYLWGGTDPEVGLDCSALVQHAYRDIGVELPRVSRDQARMGVEVANIEAAQPGDLVAFGNPVDHISIYVGDGKILHAPRTGDVVKVAEISRPITTIRRVVASPTTGFVSTYGSTSSTSSTTVTGSAAEAQYQSLFTEAGEKYGVDPALLAAVASVESGFNATAQSSAGAQGLMQFMPATAAEMGVDPMDPESAIDGAARYLRRELDRFGSVSLAAAAYNAGAGAVSKYGGIPPYSETQNYVKKVLSAYEARQ